MKSLEGPLSPGDEQLIDYVRRRQVIYICFSYFNSFFFAYFLSVNSAYMH